MTDAAYEMLFKPVMRRVMEVYQPEVVVFQSGEELWLSIMGQIANLSTAPKDFPEYPLWF